MAPATASPTNERDAERALALGWTGRVSLTSRILAVNVLALLLLAGGFFYLDSYRSRLVDSRTQQQGREAALIAEALRAAPSAGRAALMVRLGRDVGARIRSYDRSGHVDRGYPRAGARQLTLRDPDRQNWRQDAARFLDAAIDTIVRARRDPLYRERRDRDWPDVRAAALGHVSATVWRSPERTPVITAAAPLGDGGAVMTTISARDITQTVRNERLRLTIVLAIATLLSILLSLFLARTIVRPIRRLARAAVRVKLGRDREVVVPRPASRADELGRLRGRCRT